MLELANARECKCSLCEEGRFIKRISTLLPEADATELNQWYCALLDATCEKEMDFYWIDLKLKETQSMIAEFIGKQKQANHD